MDIFFVDASVDGLDADSDRLGPDSDTPASMRRTIEELSERFTWDAESDRRAFVEEYSCWETVWVCRDPFAHACSFESRPLVAETRWLLEQRYLEMTDRI